MQETAPGEPPVSSCVECGRPARDAAERLVWTTTLEAGRARGLCAGCSRTHLRAIEARLDRAWW